MWNLKLVIKLECQNKKTFLEKITIQIGLKKLLWLKKLKTLYCGHILLMEILMEKKLLEHFTKQIAKGKSKRV